MKRVIGLVEVIFNITYITVALSLAFIYLLRGNGTLPGLLPFFMTLVLVIGDSFHLVPRILVVLTKKEEKFRKALGLGKLITSITMAIFYLLLWHIGLILFDPKTPSLLTFLVYLLTILRIILCLLPYNKWRDRHPPVKWGVIRNIPFVLQGLIVAYLYFINRDVHNGVTLMGLAILLSFAFYIPVVLLVNKYPKIGMLMLPKTCVYLWIIIILLRL
jgi:hypothetical protein